MAWIPYAVGAAASVLSSLSKSGEQKIDLGPGKGTFKHVVIPQLQQLLGRSPDQLTAPLGTGLQDVLGELQNWYSGQGAMNLSQLPGIANGAAGVFGDVTSRWMDGGQPQVGDLNFDYARRVADNPQMDAMITAALRDPMRQLTEQDLPGLYGAAAGTGNTGSSRTGLAEGILQRGFEDRAADVGATMRGAAYDRGLTIAGDQAIQNAQLGLQGDIAGFNLGGLAGETATNLNTLGMGNLLAGFNAGDFLRQYQQQTIDAPLANLEQITKLLLPATGMTTSGRSPVATGVGTFTALLPMLQEWSRNMGAGTKDAVTTPK